MEIVPVEDRDTMVVWQDVEARCLRHDHVGLPADPVEERVAALSADSSDTGERTLFRLAYQHGHPIGAIELSVPTLDNLSAATVRVQVLPAQRRSGFGRRLLDAAREEVAGCGRTTVFVEAPSPYPAGPGPADGLLRAAGGRPVLREVRRLLSVAQQRAVSVPAATGYHLVPWVDVVPAEDVADMAHLLHLMSTDAPLGEMSWEPEAWDADRYRAREAVAAALGRTRIGTLVRHEASGTVVGFTEIGVSRYAAETGYQWDTIVERGHRGHRLGLALKVHNHRLLTEVAPDTRWLNTWNAESNTYMVGINDQLGYQPVEYWTEWQLDR